MISLIQGRREVENAYELLGTDEDAITAAVAWTLRSVPCFLAEFLNSSCAYAGSVESAQLHFQRHERRAGRTDLEVIIPAAVHLILEAKRGWELPTQRQLELYATRQGFGAAGGCKQIVTLSEADKRYAKAYQPPSVLGVPVSHLSRQDLLTVLSAASKRTRGFREKARLAELAHFLNKTMARPNIDSNWVYVVSLSRKPVAPAWPATTFLDVVVRHARYFHPVGPGRGGWPATPPNYIGFRYDGALQSIHHIVNTTVTKDLSEIAAPGTLPPLPVADPHFIYELGPAMRPAAPVPNGKGITRSIRIWAALDALLTAPSISDARTMTRARWPK